MPSSSIPVSEIVVPASAQRPDAWRVTSERRRLLIVDFGGQSVAALEELAIGADYGTAHAGDCASAIHQGQSFAPDLAIVVDLDMSSPAAARLCLHFLDEAKLPFIVYSQATDVFDRVIALKLGADNYLPKPMDPRLLGAHIYAAMRRIDISAKQGDRMAIDEFGPYQVNRVSRHVRYQDNTIRLSGTEFELFWLLADQFGEVVDRRQLILALDLSDDDDFGRAIDQRIFRLRSRLSAAGAPKDAIRSVRGKGFVLTGTTAQG